MKQYRLTVRKDLLFTRAALRQQERTRVVSLLIDSGSTYTIVSWEVLLSLKLDPAASRVRRPITTASGALVLPEIAVEEFHALGQRLERFPILVHTIPLGGQVDGVLGMSFLRRFDLELNFKQALVRLDL
jgi:predicted aspartyl protease